MDAVDGLGRPMEEPLELTPGPLLGRKEPQGVRRGTGLQLRTELCAGGLRVLPTCKVCAAVLGKNCTVQTGWGASSAAEAGPL